LAIHEKCNSCRGAGFAKCTACRCPECDSTGKISASCPDCDREHKITCTACDGTGKVLKNKTWFSEKYALCWKCDSTGRQKCNRCQVGMIEMTCSSCDGTGANPSCSECAGKGKIRCQSCSGLGYVRPNWSPDRIREEIAQRRYMINEQKRELAELYDDKHRTGSSDNEGIVNTERFIFNLEMQINDLIKML
jgi:DnaJ-class molecular chaperone